MELSCSSKDNPLYPARNIPSENPYYSSLLTKLVWSRSLDDGLVFFCEFMDLDSLSVHFQANQNPYLVHVIRCFQQLDRAQFSSLLPHGTLVHCFNAWESMSLKRLYHFGSKALNGSSESFTVHVNVSDLATWSNV